jgi:hypothetical protein
VLRFLLVCKYLTFVQVCVSVLHSCVVSACSSMRYFHSSEVFKLRLQMNLLKILAQLGKNDQASSEGMYEVLVDVMKRADTGINIGYAIGKPAWLR